MTNDEIIELGLFNEALLSSVPFNKLVTEFEKTVCHNFLSTKPDQVKEREIIYATFNGLSLFLGYAQSLAKQKQQLLDPQPIEDETIPDEIDYQ